LTQGGGGVRGAARNVVGEGGRGRGRIWVSGQSWRGDGPVYGFMGARELRDLREWGGLVGWWVGGTEGWRTGKTE